MLLYVWVPSASILALLQLGHDLEHTLCYKSLYYSKQRIHACVQHKKKINIILMQLTIGGRACQSPHVPFSHLASTIDVDPTRCRRRVLVNDAAQTRSWPGRVRLSRPGRSVPGRARVTPFLPTVTVVALWRAATRQRLGHYHSRRCCGCCGDW